MKLELFVDPVDILSDSFVRRPLLISDVLGYLLFQSKKERQGRLLKITELYRIVAVDILSYVGIVVPEKETAESKRRIWCIVEWVIVPSKSSLVILWSLNIAIIVSDLDYTVIVTRICDSLFISLVIYAQFFSLCVIFNDSHRFQGEAAS